MEVRGLNDVKKKNVIKGCFEKMEAHSDLSPGNENGRCRHENYQELMVLMTWVGISMLQMAPLGALW